MKQLYVLYRVVLAACVLSVGIMSSGVAFADVAPNAGAAVKAPVAVDPDVTIQQARQSVNSSSPAVTDQGTVLAKADNTAEAIQNALVDRSNAPADAKNVATQQQSAANNEAVDQTLVAVDQGAVDPNSPLGTWQTIDDKDHKPRSLVRISLDKNGELTGQIIDFIPRAGESRDDICDKCSNEFHNQPIIGLQFMWGFKEQKPGVWTGGHILDPANGKVYKSKLSLAQQGGELKVRGYIGISLLGRTQTWERTKVDA